MNYSLERLRDEYEYAHGAVTVGTGWAGQERRRELFFVVCGGGASLGGFDRWEDPIIHDPTSHWNVCPFTLVMNTNVQSFLSLKCILPLSSLHLSARIPSVKAHLI